MCAQPTKNPPPMSRHTCSSNFLDPIAFGPSPTSSPSLLPLMAMIAATIPSQVDDVSSNSRHQLLHIGDLPIISRQDLIVAYIGTLPFRCHCRVAEPLTTDHFIDGLPSSSCSIRSPPVLCPNDITVLQQSHPTNIVVTSNCRQPSCRLDQAGLSSHPYDHLSISFPNAIEKLLAMSINAPIDFSILTWWTHTCILSSNNWTNTLQWWLQQRYNIAWWGPFGSHGALSASWNKSIGQATSSQFLIIVVASNVTSIIDTSHGLWSPFPLPYS